MPAIIHVGVSDSGRFHLLGGEPRGRDHVYQAVTAWPGWLRLPSVGKLGDQPCSVYSAPISPVTAASLASTALQVVWTQEGRNAAELQLKRLRDSMQALNGKPTSKLILPTKLNPFPHQLQAIDAIVHLQGKVLLADDMGLGKSACSLWALHELMDENILVICPASAKFNWAREVKTTLGWRSIVIDGTPARRATLLAEMVNYATTGPVVVIINYDLLNPLTDDQVDLFKAFVASQGVICDESHYIKNRSTARAKISTDIASKARHRLLLTGTPIRNRVEDLYSQVEIVQPGTWTSYWDFAKRHLNTTTMHLPTHTVRNKIVGSKNVNALNAVVNTLQIRRLKEDVLNLPEQIFTYPELELSGDHKKVYKAMKDLAVLQLNELDDGMSIFHPQAQSRLEAMLRCEQIAQGFVGGVPEPLVEKLSKILTKKAESIPGRPREVIFPDSPKLIWLIENIHTLLATGKRPVIFSRFNAPMFWLAKKFETDLVLHGALNSKQKDAVHSRFQAGEGDLMLCQVKMAEGFNLHNSQDCIFYGRDWAPSVNHQAAGRLHRIGQNGTVNVQIPIVRGTVEMLIHKKLKAKDADAEQALRTVTIRELKEAL